MFSRKHLNIEQCQPIEDRDYLGRSGADAPPTRFHIEADQPRQYVEQGDLFVRFAGLEHPDRRHVVP